MVKFYKKKGKILQKKLVKFYKKIGKILQKNW